MAVNYTSWTVEKLEKEIVKIKKAIDLQKRRNKKTALAKVKAVAKQNGFELRELIESPSSAVVATSKAPKKSAKKRSKVPPKYKNPNDPEQLWTGRGRQPLWVKAHVDAGGDVEDFAI